MVDHIDIAIVVAAERFSLPMWEYAAEYIVDCSVRIVTTRGGGGVDDMDMSMTGVARGFAKAIDRICEGDSKDIFTRVGHMTPIHPSSLVVKGKNWEKHEGCPMLWIRCHHSVRQFPDQRLRSSGKGTEQDKHKGKDKGQDKGKGKLNDRGGGKGKDKHKGKGKDKGKGKLNHRGGGKGKNKHKGKDKGKGKAKGKGKLNDRGGGK